MPKFKPLMLQSYLRAIFQALDPTEHEQVKRYRRHISLKKNLKHRNKIKQYSNKQTLDLHPLVHQDQPLHGQDLMLAPSHLQEPPAQIIIKITKYSQVI